MQVQEVMNRFEPVAKRVSQLFFVVADLANVENMYQYSLDFYVQIFNDTIK